MGYLRRHQSKSTANIDRFLDENLSALAFALHDGVLRTNADITDRFGRIAASLYLSTLPELNGSKSLAFLQVILRVDPSLIKHPLVASSINSLLTAPGLNEAFRFFCHGLITESWKMGLIKHGVMAGKINWLCKTSGAPLRMVPALKSFRELPWSDAVEADVDNSLSLLFAIEQLKDRLGTLPWRSLAKDYREHGEGRNKYVLSEVATLLNNMFEEYKRVRKLEGRLLTDADYCSIAKSGLESGSPCYEITCALVATLSLRCFNRVEGPITPSQVKHAYDRVRACYGTSLANKIKCLLLKTEHQHSIAPSAFHP